MRVGGLFGALTFVCASRVGAQAIPLLDSTSIRESGVPLGWNVMVKKGTPRMWTVADSIKAVCLDADVASFSINRKTTIDLSATPRLIWIWRADAPPTRGDFRVSSRDDQAAQLFVIFERDGPGARRAINYIWDTSAPRGASGDYHIPLVIHIKTVVVESGLESIGKWTSIQRHVASDYRTLFRSPPPKIAAVRFQVNSQHTRSRALGCIASVRFEPDME